MGARNDRLHSPPSTLLGIDTGDVDDLSPVEYRMGDKRPTSNLTGISVFSSSFKVNKRSEEEEDDRTMLISRLS